MPVLSGSSSGSDDTTFGNLAAQSLSQSSPASEETGLTSDLGSSATSNDVI